MKIILNQNVVSDDYVIIKNKIFELHYFVYKNAWQDREIIKNFRKLDNFISFYNKLKRIQIDESII